MKAPRSRAGSIALAALLVTGVVVVAGAAIYALRPAWVVRVVLARERARLGFDRKSVTIAGSAMPYLERGTGDPIVLIHGFADSKDSWLSFAATLAGEYHVIAPDLPGYGEAGSPDGGDIGVEAQAERVREFLTATGLTPGHLAGISMGGEIAGIVAAKYPERVRTLALFNAAGGWSDTITALAREIDAGANPFDVRDRAGLRILVRHMRVSTSPLPDVVERWLVGEFLRHRAEWNRAFEGLKGFPARTLLDSLAPAIARPTFVLWGEADELFHPSIARRLAARIPGATLSLVPACGHACIMEQPDSNAARYLAFLRGR